MSDIIPTVVPKSAADVAALAARFAGIAHVLHLDMTDGSFAFPTTWVPAAGYMLPDSVLWEVHLMADSPREAGEAFIRAGAWRIIGHAEALGGETGIATLQGWRAMGAKEVGVALKLDSPLSAIEHVAPFCDVLHIMSIRKIGAQGQQYDDAVLPKIRDARTRFPHVVLAVDGGVNDMNIEDLSAAGATRFCVGTGLSSASNPHSAFAHLKSLAENALQ